MGDFSKLADRLVLRACMSTMAKTTVSVSPAASQPGTAPYTARGIWMVEPVDLQMEDGSILSSERRRLGIRLSEFAVQIIQGDMIDLDGKHYIVDDTDDDGQGGSALTLKETR